MNGVANHEQANNEPDANEKAADADKPVEHKEMQYFQIDQKRIGMVRNDDDTYKFEMTYRYIRYSAACAFKELKFDDNEGFIRYVQDTAAVIKITQEGDAFAVALPVPYRGIVEVVRLQAHALTESEHRAIVQRIAFDMESIAQSIAALQLNMRP